MFCEHLTPAVVNDQIFPHIVHGFMDSNPVVREHTIKVRWGKRLSHQLISLSEFQLQRDAERGLINGFELKNCSLMLYFASCCYL